MKHNMIAVAKQRLQQLIIKDLEDFCEKHKLKPLKIIPHSKTEAGFYQIHFNNESNFMHSETLTVELTNAGYSPKDWHGNLPESFYLIVLRVLPI